MPICTYIDTHEAEQLRKEGASDRDIDDLLAEVQALDNKRWLISRRDYPKSKWWGLVQYIEPRYQLFIHVFGIEWQILNFVPDEPMRTSISTEATKGEVANFLLGFTIGRKVQHRHEQ